MALSDLFGSGVNIIFVIAIIIGVIALFYWIINSYRNTKEEKVKWGQVEILDAIHSRLGWIIFWLVIIALGIGNLP